MSAISDVSERPKRREKRPAKDLLHLVVFQLADRSFALTVDEVCEILPQVKLTRPFGSPPLLRGFVDVSGRCLPVIDGGRLFDLPDGPRGLCCTVLLLAKGDERAALSTDRVGQIVAVMPSDITPLGPDDSPSGCVAGMLRLGGTIIWRLSSERLLREMELGCPTAASNCC